ncbi:MAG: squalene/phytoene synthase family protein [Maricaulaceae bacterium]
MAAEIMSISETARQADPDRWLAARFAPAPARARLEALYAFNAEIARVREVVSDPMLGEIRLAWWREAIEEIYADPVRPRRHPVALALADAIASAASSIDQAEFLALIDARRRDLEPERFDDVGEIETYTDETAGRLAALAGAFAGQIPLDAGQLEVLRACGRAWALTGLARALPVHVAQGWITPPADIPADRVARAFSERDGEAMRACAAPLLETAERALGEARAQLPALDAELWPAYGYLALAAPRLARLQRASEDYFKVAAQSRPLTDRLRLIASAATGRV